MGQILVPMQSGRGGGARVRGVNFCRRSDLGFYAVILSGIAANKVSPLVKSLVNCVKYSSECSQGSGRPFTRSLF